MRRGQDSQRRRRRKDEEEERRRRRRREEMRRRSRRVTECRLFGVGFVLKYRECAGLQREVAKGGPAVF